MQVAGLGPDSPGPLDKRVLTIAPVKRSIVVGELTRANDLSASAVEHERTKARIDPMCITHISSWWLNAWVGFKYQRCSLCKPSSQGMRSSSSWARRATSSAKSRSEKECRPNDHSWQSQQFFPAASPRPWQKSLVPTANTHPWWTPDSIVNQALSDWNARTQLTELLYRVLIFLIWLSCLEYWAWPWAWSVTKAMNGWVNQRQHTNRHTRPRRSYHSYDHRPSLAVVVQCCIKLMCTWTGQGRNRSAQNVCVPESLVLFLLVWLVQTPSLAPKAIVICNCCSQTWILSICSVEWTIIPRCHFSGITLSSQTRVKMQCNVLRAAVPPRKIYFGLMPHDPGALPAFTLFAALWVSVSVRGNVSMRESEDLTIKWTEEEAKVSLAE